MNEKIFKIVPLGGLGEFGMNMMAVGYDRDIIVVDAGLMFPREDLLGVDFVIPDFQYLLENREKVRAIFLTHGHEDHVGALPYLLKDLAVPVYATPLTLGFAQGRLEENGVLDEAELIDVEARDTWDFGDLHVEVIHMTHSIADSIGLAITSPAGTIIMTGDYKLDSAPVDQRPTDYARLSHYGEQGVLALFGDSTNSEYPGFTESETYVRKNLETIFHASRRKIVVACFASSIHRIQIVLNLARDFGRRVILLGRSMKQNISIASDLGYLDIPPGVLADASEARAIPDNELIVLSTGSQGEPLAALTRLAFGKQKGISVKDGDSVVISARVIPGNELRVSRLINLFCRHGARVYEGSRHGIHVSGHASQEELKIMLNLTRPRYFMPIHGEYRQLKAHAMLAEETGIPKDRILIAETGDIIYLGENTIRVDGKAPVGRRLIDAGGIAELDEDVIGDRQRLSVQGVVLAVVVVDKSTGGIKGVPEIAIRGHVQGSEEIDFLAEARRAIVNTFEECTLEERADSGMLTENIRAALKRYFRKGAGTRPM
ncbi:MAG: ribonuclease J, partial [Acidobacteriota bacterium]|nr:ribonuclease J [Acidobacteriota bacterium]